MERLKSLFHLFFPWVAKTRAKNKTIKALREKLRASNLEIVVGAGGVSENGWVATDIESLDLLKVKDWKRLFKTNSISKILAEHVWEHLTPEQGRLALSNCYTYLRKGGHIRIAVPDGFNTNADYINYVKPGGHGVGADDHKLLYNYQTLSNYLEQTGFKVELLEYFDENGAFHAKEWRKEDGMVWRSKNFDERNSGDTLNYTSLIVDGFKL